MRERLMAALAAVLVAAGVAGAQARVPLSLREAVSRAGEGTAAARVAELQVADARARVGEARSELLPQLSATGLMMRHTFNMNAFGFRLPTQPGVEVDPLIGPVNQTDARVRLSQTLFDPAGLARVRARRVAVSGAAAQAEAAREQAAQQAALAYVRAGRADARVAAREADVKLAAELLELARAQLEAGVSTVIDVTRARTQQVSAEGALLLARGDADQAQIALARALGMNASTRYSLTDSIDGGALVEGLPTAADALVELARSRRADVRAADAAGVLARRTAETIRAERLPRVGLFADYGASGLNPGDALPTREVGLQVSLPLVDGFRREARMQEQTVAVRASDVRAADVREQVQADVESALLELRSGRQLREIATERLQLAEQELDQARERFANGVAGNIELINAQSSLNRARDALIDAAYAIGLAQADLARATGTAAEDR